MHIDFMEAIFGAEKTIQLDKNISCSKCSGSGNEPGSKTVTCRSCEGSGQVGRTIGFGIEFSTPCSDCGGSGKRNEKNCIQCRGQGIAHEKETIQIKIPAGIDNGQTMKFRGKGEAGVKGGEAGDLYITYHVKPHPKFGRNGSDILSKIFVTFIQAALGTKLEVDTVNGPVILKIPEGTQSGRVFCIKGKGAPKIRGYGHGDHLAEVIIQTPTRLTKRQRQLLEEFEQEQ